VESSGNPLERLVRRVDAYQQRHRGTAFAFGVVKKFGDDNAGVLVNNLAHAGFVSLFPLLLVLVTVASVILGQHPALRQQLLHTAFGQIPIVGPDLASNVHRLQRGSPIALGVGIVSLVWGCFGLAQAGLFTMSQVWNLPGTKRPNYWVRLARSLLFLTFLGLGVVVTTPVAGLGAIGHHSPILRVGGLLASTLLDAGMFLAVFRILTPAVVPGRRLWPGALVGGVAWSVLQVLGSFLIGRNLRIGSEVYGLFAIVLGVVAWVYLLSEITVYAAELNVVLALRLWPRSIVQPPFTPADRRAMAMQATQNIRSSEEGIEVSFGDPADAGAPGVGTPRMPEGPVPA
jgi:YihY family inner membrane protein